MSDNAESASIDLSVNADAAVETMKQLASAAKDADADLQRLKQTMATEVNAAFGSAMGTTVDYSHAANIVRGMQPADIAAAVPGVPALQQQIAERGGQITGQAMDFTSANPQAAGQPIPALLAQFQEAQARQAEQSQRQQEAQQARQAQPTAPASVSSGAQPGDPVSNAARYGLAPASTSLTPFGQPDASTNDTTRQDRAAKTTGDRIAESLSRYAGGLMTGGIGGAANAAGMGATGDLVGALARPLMELVSAPLAIGAAVIGGAAGIGLGVNSLQSTYAGEERQLAGAVGTSTGSSPEGELTTAQQAGWRYWYHEKDSVAAAQQLGDVGVTSDQMGGALTQSMALARLSGVGLDQTTALTGQMMQGGMSSNQVGDAYAQLDQVSRLLPVSLGRITEGLKAVNAAAGVGQISLNGLAATQALSDTTGMKINIGQAMAGTIGSTGTSALAQGYMLGLDPAQFDAAQKDPAKLWDAYANTARRYDVGAGGERIAQQALSQSGFDFSSMKGGQADTFIQKLVSEGPGAAQKYEQSLQQKENAPHAAGPHTADQFAAAGKAFADQVTPIGKQLEIAGEKTANALVRGAQDAAYALTPLEVRNQQQQQHDRRYGPSGVGTSHTTNVNPMQQLTQSTQGRGGLLPLPGSYMIPNGQGNSNRVLPYQMQWYEDAAKKYAPPGTDPNEFLSVLLAQGSAESGFNENAVSRDKNGNPIAKGIAQFTPATAAEYGLKNPFDARKSIAAQAHMDANLYQSHGRNWEHALAAYNGSGPQAAAYGHNVASAAQQVQGQIGVTVTVKNESGHQIAHTQTTHNVTAHPAHSIDPTRRHVASQSYGPQDRMPPAPGIPTLPGHFGGPIRR